MINNPIQCISEGISGDHICSIFVNWQRFGNGVFENSMPNPRKEARLWLRKAKARPAVYVILDRGSQFSTKTDDENEARQQLETYICHPPHMRRYNLRGRKGRVNLGRNTDDAATWLYAITQSVPDCPIKIGVAKDVAARVHNLQTSSPFVVKVIGAMKTVAKLEKAVHSFLKQDCVRGEWFHRSERVNTVVELIQSENHLALTKFIGMS